MLLLFRLLLVMAFAFACGLLATAAEAKRVAFVVGNAEYGSVSPLKNPQRDAAAVADRLKDLGFEVTELFNADAFSLNRAAMSFVAKAKSADLALFYFAGHGVQLFDRNVLLARDADPKGAKRVQDLGLDLTSFMAALRGSGAVRLALLIDACRDNPLSFDDTVRLLDRLRADPAFKAAPSTTGRGTRGLARIEIGPGGQASTGAAQTLLFFAAQPGAVSFDGAGLNSYLVEGLKEQLARPDRGFKEMLEGVIGYVRTVTGNRQVPQLVSDWAAEVPMGASTPAVRIEYKVQGKDFVERILTPAERDVVLRAAASYSSFRGDFIAKASVGDDFSHGSSEDEKRAAKLGTVSSFSLSYDLDRDGREETIHLYPGQVGLELGLETAGVKVLFSNCGGGWQTAEIALRDINGDRKPEIWIAYADDGNSRMWGKLCILEYTGLANLADLRRGNTGLLHVGSKAFRTLLRGEAGWSISVATDHGIKVCAGSNCHTPWKYSFDGERFRLLIDGGMEPTAVRALPFKDMKERAARIVSHLLKDTTPLTPYGWKLAQPKAGSATVTASIGSGAEIAFECGNGDAFLTVRGRVAEVDETLADDSFANAPVLIDGRACALNGGGADSSGAVKLFLGETGATDGCWTGLQKASLVTLPVLWQSKALLQLRMTEASRYLAAAQRACSGDRGGLSDLSLAPPVGLKPPPPVAPTDDIRARIARFISQQYFQYSTATETRQIVAPSVDSYGKRRTREEVVREKMNYYAKWPDRMYTLMPETLEVSADPGQPGRWNAVFQYTFRVSNQKRVISGRGVARLGLVPAPGGGLLIASESGEVLERY